MGGGGDATAGGAGAGTEGFDWRTTLGNVGSAMQNWNSSYPAPQGYTPQMSMPSGGPASSLTPPLQTSVPMSGGNDELLAALQRLLGGAA